MAAPKKPRLSSKDLSNCLRELGTTVHDWGESGAVSKAEALAALLWKKALGWDEKRMDDKGREESVAHKPEAWAIALVWERIEGRVPQATIETSERMRAAEKVRNLSSTRLNTLAATLVPLGAAPASATPRPARPPRYSPGHGDPGGH